MQIARDEKCRLAAKDWWVEKRRLAYNEKIVVCVLFNNMLTLNTGIVNKIILDWNTIVILASIAAITPMRYKVDMQ